jgi:hypothetical protein
MKKKITIALLLLFTGACLFAQDPHHDKDGHREIRKEYRHHPYRHDYHRRRAVVIQPIAPEPPSVRIELPSPPPPPRPPR